MKLTVESIEELFVKSERHEELFRLIDHIIHESAPELKRYLFSSPSITVIGYGEMPGKVSADGQIWPLISLAPQKNSVNMYISAERDGVPLPQCYRDHFGKSAVGKSCIRISSITKVNDEILKQLIRETQLWKDLKDNKYGKL